MITVAKTPVIIVEKKSGTYPNDIFTWFNTYDQSRLNQSNQKNGPKWKEWQVELSERLVTGIRFSRCSSRKV